MDQRKNLADEIKKYLNRALAISLRQISSSESTLSPMLERSGVRGREQIYFLRTNSKYGKIEN